jgi:DNA ligase D-like protein (predicted 3'-phosphoesterase)
MAADDKLALYKSKRDFAITSEPAEGGEEAAENLSFVIQKHWASRLHYDFRLELDGTMKSWAVPKGPSYDPTEKRMAVHVEDHPISYSAFERHHSAQAVWRGQGDHLGQGHLAVPSSALSGGGERCTGPPPGSLVRPMPN